MASALTVAIVADDACDPASWAKEPHENARTAIEASEIEHILEFLST